MTAQNAPLVTIILPAFNVGGYVGAAITSLKDQSFTAFEALVIDDGSTDDTNQQAQAAIGDDARFHLIRQQNRGLSGARNTGLDMARAPVIAFLDGDDRYHPQFLKVLYTDLISSKANWIACAIAFCTADGTKHLHSAIHGRPVPQAPPTHKDYPLGDWADVIRHFPSAWNKLYRRDFIGDIRFDEGTWYEDHSFFQRLAGKADTLRHVSHPLYFYTLEREGQITRADNDRVFEQFDVLETCAKIMRSGTKTGAETGLARLATRLCNERLDSIRSPDRAQRFKQMAASFFRRHNLRPDWAWDKSLNALRSSSFSGQPPITIRLGFSDHTAAPPEMLLPDPTSPLHELFQIDDRSTAPSDGLVLDVPFTVPLNHTAIAEMAERLLHADSAAALSPPSPPPGAAPFVGAPPPAGLSATEPARFAPDQMLDLCLTDHSMLVKAAYAIPLAAFPEHHVAVQAIRLAETGQTVLWSPAAFAAAQPFRVCSVAETLRRFDWFRAELTSLPLPVGWDRRLLLRMVSPQIVAMQQDDNQLRRRMRLVIPLLRLWSYAHKCSWIGAAGEVDAATPRILRRIFRLPPPA